MKNKNYLIDSHCHLDLIEEQGGDIDEAVKNAKEAGVEVLQTICTRITKFEQILEISKKYDNVYASIGIHPNNVDEEPEIDVEQTVKIIEENKNKVIGIGETGLDYYYDYAKPANQKSSFIKHIDIARRTGLPLIIHTRDADRDMAEILKEEKKKGDFKALLHCFSSSKELALAALDLGVYISISGIVTFKNAKDLQEIVKELPLDKILVETDSPYLAPVPYRGKKNQPAYTKETAEFVANLRGLEFEEIQKITTENFYELFGVK